MGRIISNTAIPSAIACILTAFVLSAAGSKYPKTPIPQLINDLTQIHSQAPGIDSAGDYWGFIANGTPGPFEGGVLGVAPPKVPPVMVELVRSGPVALPELVKHIDDGRPTMLKVGNSGGRTGQVGVNVFLFEYFSDEYDPRFPAELKSDRKPMMRGFDGTYRVKVGDVCYALIGQIVNRRLLAVCYQPSAGMVVNSPVEDPALAKEVRKDWGHASAETLKASLLADLHRSDTEYVKGALARLRFYFPATYEMLPGKHLK